MNSQESRPNCDYTTMREVDMKVSIQVWMVKSVGLAISAYTTQRGSVKKDTNVFGLSNV